MGYHYSGETLYSVSRADFVCYFILGGENCNKTFGSGSKYYDCAILSHILLYASVCDQQKLNGADLC